MRSTPLLTQTLQTPALPGFRVYGDAKNAAFEFFVSLRGNHSLLSERQLSDASAPKAATASKAQNVQGSSSFERVQIQSPFERRPGKEPCADLHGGSSFERVQIGGSMQPGTRIEDFNSRPRLSSFERVQFIASSPDAPGIQPHRPSHPPFERVQMLIRLGEASGTHHCPATSFERVQIDREHRQYTSPRGGRPKGHPEYAQRTSPTCAPETHTEKEHLMPPPQ